MDFFAALATIILACILGAVSPGPSFVLVARISMSESRTNGLFAALGMAVGGSFLALLSLLGLKAIFDALPLLYNTVKWIGGLYLIYLGVQIWRGASQPLQLDDLTAPARSSKRSFSTALFTQLSNPKAIVFFGSIFAALLPQTLTILQIIIITCCVMSIELSWYSIVALLLSSERPRSAYLHAKCGIDRTAGAILSLLGLKLLSSEI